MKGAISQCSLAYGLSLSMASILPPSVEEFHPFQSCMRRPRYILYGTNGILFKKDATILPRFGKHHPKLNLKIIFYFFFPFDRMDVIDEINSVPQHT